jgi:hypothetical protein
MKSVPKFARRSALSAAVGLLFFQAGLASATSYAPWLSQIGITDTVMSAGYWGKNQLLGVVDTGIIASNPVFAAGQVSNASSACAAVTFKCANSFVDDNGHGTAVAAIAAGNRLAPFATSYGGYAMATGSIMSVAPNANILAEKVLNAQGSGYSTDVASGVRKAADAGASVINVSITYGNSADVVSAINYAASKGAFIVWAGGNDAKTLLGGASTSGLTASAIQHLLLVGSVNSGNALSSFSNTPGTGSLVDTSGAKKAYLARWIMAPGESIIAPGIQYGPTSMAYWSGTSMSTPLISGSLLLLESAWPILKTNGTAADLLLLTAKDLGAKGVDATFGNGLANLTTAFQPYGALTVTQANGKAVALSSLTGKLISGGALGALTSVQSKLASYATFDGYLRNFTVNLSGLIKSPSMAATLNPLPTNANTGPTKIKLADGAELSYWQPSAPTLTDTLGVFALNGEIASDRRFGYSMMTDRQGTTTALGYGFPVQFSYAKALFGDDDLARLSGELGVANLSGIAQGGGLVAYGTKVTESTRVALSWSGTATSPAAALNGTPTWATSDAKSINLGITHRFDETFSAGISLGTLNENHGLLGSTYQADSPLSLGANSRSVSIGFSAGFKLDRDNSVMFESGFATTSGNTATGLFSGITDIRSRSCGMTALSRNLFSAADNLVVSVKQPLRVVAGQAGLVTPSLDDRGVAHFNTEWTSLAPSGRELDFKLAYDAPVGKLQTLSLQASYRKDVLNVAGSNDASVGMSWAKRF